MKITVDDAQQFMVNSLFDLQRQNQFDKNRLDNLGFDLSLDVLIKKYLNMDHRVIPSSERAQKIEQNFVPFCEAAWDLCRKGILRPGKHVLGGGSLVQEIGAGFSITQYGHEWLTRSEINDLLPADPNRLIQLFDAFQLLFGKNYFRRAKEAMSCYQTGNFLACCVMCGAATESILLAAAFKIEEKEDVLIQYIAPNGRVNIEKIVFGKASEYVKKRYQKYTDLIVYWRNESGHGHDSDIDKNEPYISLLSLLHFAEFMRDQWDTLTAGEVLTTN